MDSGEIPIELGAGSPRNSFRASLEVKHMGVEH